MRIFRFSLLLFFLLICNPLGAAEPPKRIISLAPSITENLYLLGAEDKLVGVTIYCNAKDKERVGTLIEPNIEKIVSLSPDCVLVNLEGNPPKIIDSLNALGIKAIPFGPNDNLESILNDFIRLGKIIDKESEAINIVSHVRDRIQAINQKVKVKDKVKVFWQVGTNPLITTGRNSFNSDLIRLAGGENLFSDLGLRYSRVSREEVILRNPDLIVIIIDMGHSGKDEINAWSKFDTISAVKNGRIYLVDADSVCQPSPMILLGGFEKLARLIHPECFDQ